MKFLKKLLRRQTHRMTSRRKYGKNLAKLGNFNCSVLESVIRGNGRPLTSVVIRFLGVTANEEYGGLGMGYQAHCIVMEEISRASGIYQVTVLGQAAQLTGFLQEALHCLMLRIPSSA